MRKVLKKSIILYKPLFQVIIAGPVGVTLQEGNPAQPFGCAGFPYLGCIPGSTGMPQAPTVNYCIKLLNTLSYILTINLNISLIWSL